MPAAATAGVGNFLLAVFGGVSAGATAAAYFIANIIVVTAINYGLTRIQQSLAGKPKLEASSAQRDVTVRGTTEPMQMIYGEVVTPGFIANYATSGANNRYLHFVVVVAAHQCQEISDALLDGQTVPAADIDGSGDVSTAEFQGEGASRLRLVRHLGTKAQTADSELAGTAIGGWSADHRGAGVAWVHVRLDGSDEAFPAGAPTNFRFLTKGRLLYDPRKDSTNGGSGAHRYTDATTWEWSNCEPLCRSDYITGGSRWYDDATPEPRLGFGENPARINWAYVIAAANIADEDVAIPGSTTQKRYTCDVQLSCGDTYKENLRVIESASVGTTTYVDGQYRIYVGAYDTPSDVAITEDDILGPITVNTHPVGEENYNAVGGTFYDETRDWSKAPFPTVVNSSYAADDGGQKIRTIELHATRTSFRAQRIAILHNALSRDKTTIRFERLSPKAMGIAQHETFPLTISEHGFDETIFRCKEWEFLPDGFVAMTARITSADRYDDPSVGTYATGEEGTVDTPEYDLPVTPIDFEARSMPNGIAFRWKTQVPGRQDQLYRLYEHTAITPFSSATEVWSGKSLAVLLDRADYTTRYYWVTATLNGIESDETPTGDGLAASWKGEDTSAFAVDAAGKPAGIRGVQGITDRSQLQFGGSGIQILSTPDTEVGYGFPAIPIDDTATYQFTIRHKSSAASASGLQLLVNELNAALPSGATHIGTGGEVGIAAARSSVKTLVVGAMPGTTAVESSYTYTPTSGTKFASFSMYNWNPATAGVTYEVEWVRLVRTGSNVNLLAQGAYATEDLIPNAATEVRTQQDAGPISSGSLTNDATDIETLSFTAQHDGDLVVTIGFDASKTAGAGSAFGAARMFINSGASIFTSSGSILDGTTRSFVQRIIGTVSAGDDVDVILYSKHSGGTSTASYSNIDIETEFIKR